MSDQRYWRIAALVALAALLAVCVAPIVRSLRGPTDSSADQAELNEGQREDQPADALASKQSKTHVSGSESASAVQRSAESQAERDHKKKVARAMDLASIRSLIVTLKVSAIDENEAIHSSTLHGLKRYGHLAKPLLQEELDTATNDKVRQSLEDALFATQ